MTRPTIVALHAHPDDEALFTGGTLARYAAAGHRVVLVTATDGERGLTGTGGGDLGARRGDELDAAAAALGVSRVVRLGYADSGFRDPPVPPAGSWCAVAVEEAAARVAQVLVEESAGLLTVYDANGGYGHRDHVRVREVGLAAAAHAGTPRVLAATVEREALLRAVWLLARVGVHPGGASAAELAGAFSTRSEITHELDVRPWLEAKRAALRAHASQRSGGADVRTLALLTRLPRPLARLVLGREWFVEVGRTGDESPRSDLFAP